MSTIQNQKNKKVDIGYLKDFEQAIDNQDPPAILRLWEEYTSSDEVDGEDFRDALLAIKASDLSDYIGRHVERAIPLWEKMSDGELADTVLQLIVDLQVTNSKELREVTLTHLIKKFESEKLFNEKMRIIGMRSGRGDYTGAISNYLLLNHMKKGNFVFHTQGWGVGEIIDVSMIREQLSLEFDYVPGIKEMSFKTSFATLIPLPDDHFLALRFGSPDELEERAKKNPVEVMRMLLKDLGPKTAAEIKDELCELVIPEKEWNRWWQTARAKVKKDTSIESPTNIKKPFKVLKEEVSHEQRLEKALEQKPDADTLIQMVYSFMKDFSDSLKNSSFKESLIEKLQEMLSFQEITEAQELQIHFFLQDLLAKKDYEPIKDLIKKTESIEKTVSEISIQAYKKKTLTYVRKYREDWQEVFLQLFLKVEQNLLRDYILNELKTSKAKDELKKKLEELLNMPSKYPEVVIWYFQKVMGNSSLLFGDAKGRGLFFEALLILLSSVENIPEKRDQVKKIHNLLLKGRYQLVRDIMKDADMKEVQEFLLLVTKCHSLSEHDIQIFHSLAEVAHPKIKNIRKEKLPAEEEEVIWTTQDGYSTLQKRIEQIGTVETVENAKEIEVARSHGDLRENAEFKAALEKRDRLQTELKFLSDQLNKCNILSKADINTKEVGVGTIIEFDTPEKEKITYTLLGPWDADTEKNILSFQSKVAQEMTGKKVGDSIEIQGKKLKITGIKSAL